MELCIGGRLTDLYRRLRRRIRAEQMQGPAATAGVVIDNGATARTGLSRRDNGRWARLSELVDCQLQTTAVAHERNRPALKVDGAGALARAAPRL